MNPNQRLPVKWTGIGCALLVLAIGLGIAGVLTGIAFLTGFAPIALTLAAWVLCYRLFERDHAPWEQTRVASVLLIGCFSYAILGATFHLGGAALTVISSYLGYIAWRALRKYATMGTRERRTDGRSELNPLGTFAALLLAIFLVIVVVNPVMDHLFPQYWHSVTTQFLHWSASAFAPFL